MNKLVEALEDIIALARVETTQEVAIAQKALSEHRAEPSANTALVKKLLDALNMAGNVMHSQGINAEWIKQYLTEATAYLERINCEQYLTEAQAYLERQGKCGEECDCDVFAYADGTEYKRHRCKPPTTSQQEGGAK